MGCSKSSFQRQVYSDHSIPPETEKIPQINLTYHIKESETMNKNQCQQNEGYNKDQKEIK